MRAPEGLGAAGRKAWARAVRAIGASEDPDRLWDTAARYAHAVDLADEGRRGWRKAGKPLLADNPNGAPGVHPLIKVMQDAERDAKRFGDVLGIKPDSKRAHRGPDPKAVVQADIGQSPAARLRAVK